MTLEVDEDLDEQPAPPPERPHSMAGVVALLVATMGLALDDHYRRAYALGAARAGVTDPQPIELLALESRVSRQRQFLESGFASDVLEKLQAARDADEIDEAFAALEARAEMYAAAAWPIYQAGFKDFGRTGQLVEFRGPDDERDCEYCRDAVEGNPYVLELAPEPGAGECLSRCRHEIVPLTDGDLFPTS